MSEERTLATHAESRVGAWVKRESWGHASGLELGCGVGAYTREMLCQRRTGVDAFPPYIFQAIATPENKGCEFVLGDMRAFELFVPQHHDLILFVDSLEHIDKDDAVDLIVRCKARATQVSVFVPIGVHEQDPCDGNEMQRHLSTWDVSDFEDLGFSVKLYENFHNDNPVEKQAAAFARWTAK